MRLPVLFVVISALGWSPAFAGPVTLSKKGEVTFFARSAGEKKVEVIKAQADGFLFERADRQTGTVKWKRSDRQTGTVKDP